MSLRFARIFEDFLGIQCELKKKEFCRQTGELVPPVQKERHIQKEKDLNVKVLNKHCYSTAVFVF